MARRWRSEPPFVCGAAPLMASPGPFAATRAAAATASYTAVMTPDPLAADLNPLQRAWLTRLLPCYRRLDDATLRLIVERDKLLLSRSALGLWTGLVCGIAGTRYGLASSGLNPWLASLSARWGRSAASCRP